MNDIYSTFERRVKILAILINRDIVSKSELAQLFSVSNDAISDDVAALDGIVCIKGKRGRYGGIYIENKPRRGKEYFTMDEEFLLREFLPTLSGKKKLILETMLFRFSMPHKTTLSAI